MRYENNDRLREYLDRGAAGAYREHLRHPRFEFDGESFAAALDQVCAQFPELTPEDAQARAAFRLLTSGVAPEVAVPLPSRWYRVRQFLREKSVLCWPWLKLVWALAVLALSFAAVVLLSAMLAHAEPRNLSPGSPYRRPGRPLFIPVRLLGRPGYLNALRGASLLSALPAGLPALPAALPDLPATFALSAAPQQPGGIILQFQQSGSPLATRPTGLVSLNCSTGLSCSFAGTTFTLTTTGAGSGGCTPPGVSSRLLYDDGAGGCADTGLTWSGSTATAPSGVTLTYSGSGIINARNWAGTGVTNTESLGKIPIGNGDGTASWADPFVSGICAHDASCTTTNPVLVGGYASAAAPSDVSADGDGVRGWFLRNGSQVFNLASGGTLVTLGQKTMSSSLPVTLASDQSAVPVRGTFWPATQPVSAASLPLPTGASTLAEQQTQTTALQTIDNIVAGTGVNVSQFGGTNVVTGTGTSGSGIPRVTVSNDSNILATQSGNWTSRIAGNGGATLDSTVGAGTAPANQIVVGCVYNSTELSPTTGQAFAQQCDSKGRERQVIMDAAGNTRGANVDASNRLSVTVDNVSATNISTNVAQMNGVAVTMGNGTSGTGVQRVAIASDNSNAAGIGASATGSAVPSAAHYAAGNGTGNLTGYLNCDNTAVYDAATNGSTQLVALTSSQTVYVCGYQISQSTSTAVSVKLIYGTGTACATGSTNMTPAYPLQAAASTGPIGMVVMTPGFTGLKTAASNALCINTNAAVSVQAMVWYTKF